MRNVLWGAPFLTRRRKFLAENAPDFNPDETAMGKEESIVGHVRLGNAAKERAMYQGAIMANLERGGRGLNTVYSDGPISISAIHKQSVAISYEMHPNMS